MAKILLDDLSNISGNETSAVATINENSDAIETAIENTLSRDGTSPNAMNADFDMNSYDILNVGNIDTTTLYVGGVDVHSIVGPEGPQGDPGPAGAAGVVQSVVAGTGISVNSSDPANPIITNTGAVSDGDKGDIVVSMSGTVWQFDSGVVTAAAKTVLDDTTTSAMRTTLGVGTGDSPQFTAIELGSASDTTLARSSAGNVSVEGNLLYRAGGTDVAVADGGTNLSSYTAGDLLYASGATTLSKIAIGTEGYALKAISGVPTWSQSREVLTASRTYYVRTDGSDSNTGLANTSGGAFLTIQKAMTTVSALDCGTFDVVIQVGNGTYTAGAIWRGHLGSGTVVLRGDTTTPANVVISTTSADALNLIAPARLTVEGVKVQTTTSGNGIVVPFGTMLSLGVVNFGACLGYTQIRLDGGYLVCSANYTISGDAGRHASISSGATVDMGGNTVTLSGSPAFSGEFIYGSLASKCSLYNTIFSGAATGKRYSLDLNTVINTYGAAPASATYFPGNSAGTASSGAQVI